MRCVIRAYDYRRVLGNLLRHCFGGGCFGRLGLARCALALRCFDRRSFRRFGHDFHRGLVCCHNSGLLARRTGALGLFSRSRVGDFRSGIRFGHIGRLGRLTLCTFGTFFDFGVLAFAAFGTIIAPLASATATTATLLAAGFAIFIGGTIFADGCLIITVLVGVFAVSSVFTLVLIGVFAFSSVFTIAPTATTAAATLLPAATRVIAGIVTIGTCAALARLAFLDLVLGVFFLVLFRQIVVIVVDDRFELRSLNRARTGAGHSHLRAFVLAFRHDFDVDAVTMFDLDQIGALFVEEVDRRLGARRKPDLRALAARRLVFDQTQRRKARR